MRSLAATTLIITLLFACSRNGSEQKTLEDQNAVQPSIDKEKSLKSLLPGEWRNLSMKVNIKSFKNSLKDSITEVPEGQWEAILKIMPIRTFFKEDGTFSSEYRNLSDSIVFTSSGTWTAIGDTLSMTEAGGTSKYFTRIVNGKAEFTGYIDWDEDGKTDDLYFGIQKKF